MLALVLVATVINYIDRVNISVIAPFMTKDLGIDKVEMGLIFSAFAWTYAFALIPGGYIADRFGSRLGYAASLASWSVATVLQGFSNGFASLFGFRLAVGAMESPAFPANARAVTMWFPERERGLATSTYVMGQYIGTALFSGLLLWMATALGWRVVFYVTGAVGVAYAAIWWRLYRDPLQSTRANAAEIDFIRDGGALLEGKKSPRFNWASIAKLMTYRQIWAICIGKFASSSALYFFLTWFPTYLIEERHMQMLKAGIFTVMPYLGATLGILLAGWFSDYLIRRGVSLSAARKTPLVAGSLLGTSIVLANFTSSDSICIAILTCAFFAQGISATS
jgi:sugar phosphate permease